jgi:hypothetical protein
MLHKGKIYYSIPSHASEFAPCHSLMSWRVVFFDRIEVQPFPPYRIGDLNSEPRVTVHHASIGLTTAIKLIIIVSHSIRVTMHRMLHVYEAQGTSDVFLLPLSAVDENGTTKESDCGQPCLKSPGSIRLAWRLLIRLLHRTTCTCQTILTSLRCPCLV